MQIELIQDDFQENKQNGCSEIIFKVFIQGIGFANKYINIIEYRVLIVNL